MAPSKEKENSKPKETFPDNTSWWTYQANKFLEDSQRTKGRHGKVRIMKYYQNGNINKEIEI